MRVISPAPKPPLIRAERVPLWLVFRDILVTAAAWLVIAQSMRHGFHLLYDYLSPPVFVLTNVRTPDVLAIWNRLRGFVLASVCMMLWVAFWAFDGNRRLRKGQRTPQPDALPISEHAKYAGVKEDELARWKTYRIALVELDTANRVASVSPLEPVAAVIVGMS